MVPINHTSGTIGEHTLKALFKAVNEKLCPPSQQKAFTAIWNWTTTTKAHMPEKWSRNLIQLSVSFVSFSVLARSFLHPSPHFLS